MVRVGVSRHETKCLTKKYKRNAPRQTNPCAIILQHPRLASARAKLVNIVQQWLLLIASCSSLFLLRRRLRLVSVCVYVCVSWKPSIVLLKCAIKEKS